MGRLNRSVVLVGMMGAGKTAVGGQLARLLQVPFLDSDEEIEAAANMTVAEIFARDGEAFFRRKEAQVLERLLSGPPCVLSTGGGAFLCAHNRRTIAARGVSVWLKVDLELLWARVRQRSTRPLLRTPDPRATLAALLAARTPVYAQAALTVDAVPGLPVEAMARRVLAALQARPEIWDRQGAVR